jgi:plastocyanin
MVRSHTRRYIIPLVSLTIVMTLLPAAADSEVTNPEVQAVYPSWSPEQEAVKPGKTIKFVNANGLPHGVRWTGGPAEPVCTGVPIDTSSSNWNGSCTFQNEGAYTFECTVHPVMKGTIYVNSTGTIPPPPPRVTTESAGSITTTGASLEGTVNSDGQATEYFFEYGTTMGYGSATSPQSAGAGSSNVNVSESVIGLLPGTTYHFRLVATYASGSGKVLGADSAFTTALPPGPPTATTDQPTELSETEATLNGQVNPKGGEETKYWFEWSTGSGAAYEHRTPEVALFTDDVQHPATAVLTGLAEGSEYHYRVVATNKVGGPITGSDVKFTTASTPAPKSEPPAKEPTKEPAPTGTSSTPAVIASALPKPEEKLATLGPSIAAGSLRLSAPRRGSSVRVSLNVAPSGAGGRLEIDLIAKTASLAKARHEKPISTVVGRLVRRSVSAGKVSFSIALNAKAKRALRRHHKLALTAKITLTPLTGAADVLTRLIAVRA